MVVAGPDRRGILVVAAVMAGEPNAGRRAKLYTSVRRAIPPERVGLVPAPNGQKEVAGLPLARLLQAELRVRLHNAEAEVKWAYKDRKAEAGVERLAAVVAVVGLVDAVAAAPEIAVPASEGAAKPLLPPALAKATQKAAVLQRGQPVVAVKAEVTAVAKQACVIFVPDVVARPDL